MQSMILAGVIVLFGRILQDILFNMKIEIFNRGIKLGVIVINFFESIVGLFIIKLVLDLVNQNAFLIVFLGFGSSAGGLLVLAARKKYDKKLIGQRTYFARVAFKNNDDLADVLKEKGFIFTLREVEYINMGPMQLIECAFENRKRKEEFKDCLKGRPDKIVTIIPAREVYWSI